MSSKPTPAHDVAGSVPALPTPPEPLDTFAADNGSDSDSAVQTPPLARAAAPADLGDRSTATRPSQRSSAATVRSAAQLGTVEEASLGARQLAAILNDLGALGVASGVSVHVSTTAKGRLQFEARLPYADLEAARAAVEGDLRDLIERIRAAAHDAGFVLAGEDDS